MNKELIEKLLQLYTETVTEITSNSLTHDAAMSLCCSRDVSRGLCRAAVTRFGESIYDSKVLNEYLQWPSSESPAYIAQPVSRTTSLPELLDALNARVEVLHSLHSKFQNHE